MRAVLAACSLLFCMNAAAFAVSPTSAQAFRDQVSKCWIPPIGVKEILAVTVLFDLQPDGSLASNPQVTSVSNPGSPLTDLYGDAAIEAVVRCAPYSAFSQEPYDEWRQISMTFDPRQMFGAAVQEESEDVPPAPRPKPTRITSAKGDAPESTLSATGAEVGTYDDPFVYCAAVGTIDTPDERYTGPKVTEAIAAAMEVTVEEALQAGEWPQRGVWRCAHGAVRTCFRWNASSCGKYALNPTATNEMREWCAESPNSDFIPAAWSREMAGEWRCNGQTPVLVKGTASLDSQGYVPEAWKVVEGDAGDTTPTADATFDDPFDYCAAVGNVDKPGDSLKWSGPTVPDAIMNNVGEGEKERVIWRCLDGNVYWCYRLSTVPCATGAASLNMQHWHLASSENPSLNIAEQQGPQGENDPCNPPPGSRRLNLPTECFTRLFTPPISEPEVTLSAPPAAPSDDALELFGVSIGMDAQTAFNTAASLVQADYGPPEIGGGLIIKPCTETAVVTMQRDGIHRSEAYLKNCFQTTTITVNQPNLYQQVTLYAVEHPTRRISSISEVRVVMGTDFFGKLVNQDALFDQAVQKYGPPDRREGRSALTYACREWGDHNGLKLRVCRSSGTVDGTVTLQLKDDEFVKTALAAYNANSGRSTTPTLH